MMMTMTMIDSTVQADRILADVEAALSVLEHAVLEVGVGAMAAKSCGADGACQRRRLCTAITGC